MPEGDTIHRAAGRLDRALKGQRITRYWAYRPQLLQPNRSDHVVLEVQARGKNLLIHFDDQRTLYSHMRMTGSWGVYAPHERWTRPQAQARVIIETDAHVAVCFAAPVIELLSAPELLRHPTLSTLGPDLLAETLDEDEVLRRLATVGDQPIGQAVLDQRVMAGMGNVYKSEMLFVCQINPFERVRAVPEEALRKLINRTRESMQYNLHTQRRITRKSPGPDLWVYERARPPCLRCRRSVQMKRQGPHGRSTYYCPRCQSQDR